jgi:hypothetical protein
MPDEIDLKTTGKKPLTKRITCSIRLDDEAYAAIISYMETFKVSRSKAIREMLKKGAKIG